MGKGTNSLRAEWGCIIQAGIPDCLFGNRYGNVYEADVVANFDFGKYYGIGADGSGGNWYSCTLYGTEDSLPEATFVDANGLSEHYQFTLLGFSEDFSFFCPGTAQP